MEKNYTCQTAVKISYNQFFDNASKLKVSIKITFGENSQQQCNPWENPVITQYKSDNGLSEFN